MTVKNDDAIDEFMKTTLKNLTTSIRCSFDLPKRGSSEDSIFSEFPQYAKVVNGLSLKILNNIQTLIDKQDGKGNILDTAEKKALEDKFNILVEVNDRLLDKCNNLIANIEHPDANKAASVVVVEYATERAKMTPQQTIKLLSSIQIERPQLKFKKQPDNSKTPFRHILTTKPNALRPLDPDRDSHPYRFELEIHQTPTEHLLVPETSVIPTSLENTPYEFIDTVAALDRMVTILKTTATELAVDVEHHSVRTYLGLTCLVQISSRSTDYIIDTLALHDNLERLNDVFTDPAIVKVFHGANSDILWLQRDLGVYVINMFDTGQACSVLNFPRKSLSYLLERYCHVTANKEYQRLTDWRLRPLIAELIEYARTDTHYLLYIYDCMKQDLAKVDVIDGHVTGANDNSHVTSAIGTVFEASKRLCGLVYNKPIIDEYHQDAMDLYRKSNEHFNPRQLYALTRLWDLRDNIAREEDESAPFVLPHRILLSMAQLLPRETSGVLACCSQDWKLPLLRKYVYDFQKICLEAYNESLSGDHVTKPAVKSRGNVLDRLLSKHDRTPVTEEAQADQDHVTKTRVKVDNGQILFTRSAIMATDSVVSRDEAIIARRYLASHPCEMVVNSAADDAAAGNDNHVTTTTTTADIINDHVTLPPSPIIACDLTNDSSDIEMTEIVEPQPTVTKVRKVNPVTPFDYTASMAQLKQESRTADKKSKSFNPLATKKFKKNQKAKK